MLYVAYGIIYLFSFIFGSCIGSFLNVVAYRVPAGLSLVKDRSFCPTCGKQIKNRDLIPVFSFFILGGKCRSCKAKISPRYCIVEVLTGLFLCLLYSLYGFTLQTAIFFAIGCILLAISLIDFDTMTIPNSLVLAMLLPTVVIIFMGDLSLFSRLLGAVIISLPMLLLTIVIPDCFGGGDIKLIAVGGLLLGWQNCLLAAFIALLLGGGYGAYLMVSKKQRRGHIAFGPYLAVGIMVALIWGSPIISWYLGLFMTQ